jgi:dTDP-4-dehydrorhamnose 3,5-epimerase
MMQVEETAIPAVKIITPKKHGDARGFFSEVYNRSDWDKAGLRLTFVQDNHSFSAVVGVAWAARRPICTRQAGALRARPDPRHWPLISALVPAFGRHVAVELSVETGAIAGSIGFAHAFIAQSRREVLQNDSP